MHAYSTDSDRSRIAYLLLAVLAVLGAWLLSRLFDALNVTPPWWLDTPSVLGFYGLLWKGYDRFAWRWRVGALGLSDVPNLAGTWTGTIVSARDESTVYPATLTINQSASRMLVSMETTTSRSHSVMAALNCRQGPYQGLHYGYENWPKALAQSAMAPHSGQAHLRLSADGDRLDGDYETDRHRGNVGKMSFSRTQK
jgi:SMODS-associating 2TM, beta-strand rich effector domain